ncbi:hypothetical protein KFJ24_05845 [Marinobacter sediminum]|uniref:hypothetical protein n=1 Tax=Marinobacter sediminum TaxID=256323 RepID=UPI00202F7DFC|nr:hypothetical protein [Marinobacter sediminum]MCM0611997.1 hypothetical protein [Marinobacter sediminum]
MPERDYDPRYVYFDYPSGARKSQLLDYFDDECTAFFICPTYNGELPERVNVAFKWVSEDELFDIFRAECPEAVLEFFHTKPVTEWRISGSPILPFLAGRCG